MTARTAATSILEDRPQELCRARIIVDHEDPWHRALSLRLAEWAGKLRGREIVTRVVRYASCTLLRGARTPAEEAPE